VIVILWKTAYTVIESMKRPGKFHFNICTVRYYVIWNGQVFCAIRYLFSLKNTCTCYICSVQSIISFLWTLQCVALHSFLKQVVKNDLLPHAQYEFYSRYYYKNTDASKVNNEPLNCWVYRFIIDLANVVTFVHLSIFNCAQMKQDTTCQVLNLFFYCWTEPR